LNVRIVFDVDGTLLQSNAVDAALYARAFAETFGVPLPTTNWAEYTNATDRGIAEEAVARLSLPTERIDELRHRFVALLDAVEHIEPTAGATALLATLRARGSPVAIATGGWGAAARRKLCAAGLDVRGLPLVGSDDDPRRERILAAALACLGGSGRAFYVGDGPWDLAASTALGTVSSASTATVTGDSARARCAIFRIRKRSFARSKSFTEHLFGLIVLSEECASFTPPICTSTARCAASTPMTARPSSACARRRGAR
jgi:phosphoglycolate phosphatase-like HAD superfamily hydrolase